MASDSYLMAQDADPQYSEHGIGDREHEKVGGHAAFRSSLHL